MFTKMFINQEPVRFQIDCGASSNNLPFKYVEDMELKPCSQSFVMWNGTYVKPIGTCALPVENTQNSKKYKVRFLVVEEGLTPLLGFHAMEKTGQGQGGQGELCECC